MGQSPFKVTGFPHFPWFMVHHNMQAQLQINSLPGSSEASLLGSKGV